jgi:hypothetical protein
MAKPGLLHITEAVFAILPIPADGAAPPLGDLDECHGASWWLLFRYGWNTGIITAILKHAILMIYNCIIQEFCEVNTYRKHTLQIFRKIPIH